MPYRLLFPCVALLTLILLPAAAQIKPIAETKPSITIKADFVVTRTADLDALGINFGLVPFSTAERETPAARQKPLFLVCATGSDAKQLYQTLTRASRNISTIKLIAVPVVPTYDHAPVTITISAAVPDSSDPPVTAAPISLPQIKHILQVQGSLIITPRINADQSITLGFGLPTTLLRTIASGDTLVISGIQSQPGGSFSQNGVPSIVSVGGHILPDTGQTLLIFITPIFSDKS